MRLFLHRSALLLILPIVLLAGCSNSGGSGSGTGSQISDGGSSPPDDGGDTGDDDEPPSGYTLALTFKDAQDQPVQDMEVLLHKSDGTFRSVPTDLTGAANFGDIGSPKATVTWGYELINPYTLTVQRSLITAVDIPSGAHELSCPGTRSKIKFNVQVKDIPPEVTQITVVLPGFPEPFTTDLSAVSCFLDPQDLQSDGKISGLLLAKTATGAINSYNSFLDVTPGDTNLPEIYLNETKVTSLNYTIQGGSAQQAKLMFIRNGITLVTQQVGTFASPGHASGTMSIPSSFPFESVGLSAVQQDDDGDQLRVERFHLASEAPETVILALPDFYVADIVNAIDTEGRITWTASGTTEIDMQEVILSGGTDTTSMTWRHILPPGAGEVQLPELSATYTQWTEAGFNSLQIQLTDCDALHDYEDYYTEHGLELAGKCSERKMGSFRP